MILLSDAHQLQQRGQAVGPKLTDGVLCLAVFLITQPACIHVLPCRRRHFLIGEVGVHGLQPFAHGLALVCGGSAAGADGTATSRTDKQIVEQIFMVGWVFFILSAPYGLTVPSKFQNFPYVILLVKFNWERNALAVDLCWK